MGEEMRKLKVDLVELEAALENSFPEHHYFLSLESGAVILVTDETSRELSGDQATVVLLPVCASRFC